MNERDGRKRVIIENVTPRIDCGEFPVKRVLGESVTVEADVFADGHDKVSTVLLSRKKGDADWTETTMEHVVNDRWRASFTVTEQHPHEYTVAAWIDRFGTWCRDLEKRRKAGQDLAVEFEIGRAFLEETAHAADPPVSDELDAVILAIEKAESDDDKAALFSDAALAEVVFSHEPRRFLHRYERVFAVVVDRRKANFSTWYELFPRSAKPKSMDHGSFRDVERLIPYIADMGFDVLYFPPVHPVGVTNRKGPNNTPEASPGDPGSPWAIGAEDGGHTEFHSKLGSLDDFQRIKTAAEKRGIELAMDIAFQCTPDHPWVKEHPEWFRSRPDGTIQYAENPPKKYEDIFPLDFETDEWENLWTALKDVVTYWAEQGIRIFRVDNPHTKPFRFWEWLITEVRADHPDAIFLAEAFTRPKVMYRLAKAGFTQSYTYFTWRNTAWELERYFTELTGTGVAEFFRPNLWPNTPDILPEYLQFSGRSGFMSRLVLAATLSSNYGIYGPAFELLENTPREYGSEEYDNSEKYEIRDWNIGRSDSLSDYIGLVNRIRRENPALQQTRNLHFHSTDNPQLICYSKEDDSGNNIIVCVVNLDPHHRQSGWITLPLGNFGIGPHESYQLKDTITRAHFIWYGDRNYVELDPHSSPAHVFQLRKKVRTEEDFDYYL